MDETRFESLTRTLSDPTSRRVLLGTSVAGLLSVLGPPEITAKKKKPCPPCKKRKKGKCKGTVPDGTACQNGGTCQAGSCVTAPPPPQVQTFSNPGAFAYTAPGTGTVRVEALGAGGGTGGTGGTNNGGSSGGAGGTGGRGGKVTTTFAVTASEPLVITVGAAGGAGGNGGSSRNGAGGPQGAGGPGARLANPAIPGVLRIPAAWQEAVLAAGVGVVPPTCDGAVQRLPTASSPQVAVVAVVAAEAAVLVVELAPMRAKVGGILTVTIKMVPVVKTGSMAAVAGAPKDLGTMGGQDSDRQAPCSNPAAVALPMDR